MGPVIPPFLRFSVVRIFWWERVQKKKNIFGSPSLLHNYHNFLSYTLLWVESTAIRYPVFNSYTPNLPHPRTSGRLQCTRADPWRRERKTFCSENRWLGTSKSNQLAHLLLLDHFQRSCSVIMFASTIKRFSFVNFCIKLVGEDGPILSTQILICLSFLGIQ